MDLATARWLTSDAGAEALAEAARQPDPGSLTAASRLRGRWSPEQAAAALHQESLRRRAVTKFGEGASTLFLTPDGLEQASRPAVADWRAARLVAAGVRRVVDLGCGIGGDALAFARTGLELIAVERDPVTAELARANLADHGEVKLGAAEELWPQLAGPHTAVFCDPARRTSRGRSWRVQDFTPSWTFVLSLLDGNRPAVVKLGPGLPWSLLPGQAEACWLSDHGDLVECSLWAGPGAAVGARSAVLLPEGHRLRGAGREADPAGAVRVGAVLYEPDPAVSRAHASGALAESLGAQAIAPGIGYLIADEYRPTPFAQAFEVLEVREPGERALRGWVQENRIGTLEIKKRGVEVDPAVLRKRLAPRGPNSATIVLTPTAVGVRALVVRRLTR